LILDCLRVAVKSHKTEGRHMAQIARAHGITRQSFHERVVRVARFMGVEDRREKPHKRARQSSPNDKDPRKNPKGDERKGIE
jgi:hypothetical protein